ncbi:mutL-like protein 1, colon cancer, nonpolyposis type 2 [Syncephalis fuscata]|nr:mutL-like protein 1, colon cancer, nonpolyposis type 2 [Syncephalis fuscata]
MSTPRIEQLDVSVVNRIAAGEVIQRPANAFKELLENALDAGSRNIRVNVKEGGLKLLQIQDDGHGIQRDDMALACQRFSTSKLRTYEDLTSINTFGFRGEALASISHVAHVTIISKTKDAACAFKGVYKDGKLVSKDASDSEVKPCSGNDGTSIIVEDLFYTMPTRRRALRSPSDEYHRLLTVAQHYAIHNAGVSISIKKHGQNRSDLQTMNNYTPVDCIRHIYGNSVASEITEVDGKDDALNAQLTGHITNANFSQRKLVFLLFINNRSVECSALKRAVETVYQDFLPKGGKPFVYLSLILPGIMLMSMFTQQSKRSVHFLHEEAVATFVVDQLNVALNAVNKSRTFLTQTLLPVIVTPIKQGQITVNTAGHGEKIRDPHLVRTDSQSQTIKQFYRATSMSSPINSFEDIEKTTIESEMEDVTAEKESDKVTVKDTTFDKREVETIKHLPRDTAVTDNQRIKGLTNIITGHIFVGFVDDERILIQHDTRLYIMELNRISQSFFYQAMLREFCNLGLQLAVKHEMNYIDASQLHDVTELLIERRAMLLEYFTLEINANELYKLPAFLLRLGSEVDWTAEKPCLDDISRELAILYALTPPPYCALPDEDHLPAKERYRSVVEHLVLPAFKTSTMIPASLVEQRCIVQVAHLPDLYRIFERC